MPFVVTAVVQALALATPVISYSDQRSHFTSPQYTQLLFAAVVQISIYLIYLSIYYIFT